MKTFQHHNARSLKQAASVLFKHNGKARINAGGTDILGSLRDKTLAGYPEVLVNIKTIPGLDYIKSGNKGLRIGALTKLSDIVNSPTVRQDYTLIAEAARSIGSPNLRNMATIGGNLAQDVRCWYYRYPQQIGGPIICLRKGGNTCSAILGDNRYHSIFGAAPAAEGRCASHCPAHINIPEYLRHLRQGNLAEAARVMIYYNPLPAITGRVCPIFCEPQCNRGEYDDPVAIHSVERGVGDYILNHAAHYFAPPERESGKKVAIVGSGPAGLAAAFYLRKSGHQVTIYERLPEPGGMLLYSIPPYRLPKEVVRKQIQAMRGMGILFETGLPIGGELAEKIRSDSDAVFIAGGTWRSLKLGVPGEELQGVHYALEYLKSINSGETVSLGRKVVVIGGGSVAIDAARTARRTGADEVHLVCLETRDLVSKDRMPALDPEIQEAEEEGISIHPCLGIREIIRENGMAGGIETIRCISVHEPDGRFHPQYDADSPSLSLQCDSVIIAIGQASDPSPLSPGEGVFVGGDMAEGPSTVIQAVASAQKVAEDIDRLLGGRSQAKRVQIETEYPESSIRDIARVKAVELPADERIRSLQFEDIPGLSPAEIEAEAQRCIYCGCPAVGPSDLATALVALDASVVTTKRTLAALEFFAATASSSTVLESDELIKEIRIPKPPRGARQSYAKFTLRKPIDFALVSVASVVMMKNGVCSDARIALGAVAPSPIRAKAAEAALKGKPIDEASASDAAALALAGARPLSMNSYKVEIARTLVKRAIQGASE